MRYGPKCLAAEGTLRQEEIAAKLAGIPDLQIVRSHREEAPASAKPAVIITSSTSTMKDPDPKLLQCFATIDREVDFTRSALAVSGSLLAHAHLLNRLEQEFPATERQTLSEEGARQLDELLFEEAAALHSDSRPLDKLLEPLSRHFVRASGADHDGLPAVETEASSAATALAEARHVDRLTRGLLTSNTDPLSPGPALRELHAVLRGLKSVHSANRRSVRACRTERSVGGGSGSCHGAFSADLAVLGGAALSPTDRSRSQLVLSDCSAVVSLYRKDWLGSVCVQST